MYRDNKKVDVLFLIEHRDRELDTICAIAKTLKSKYSLSVAIGSLLFHSLLAAFFIRPKVIVLPFAYRQNNFPISLFQKIYKNKIIYANLNLEQILSPVNIEYKKPSDRFVKKILKQFSWGNAFKVYLLKNGVKEKNIYLTGSPAITSFIDMTNCDKGSLKHSIVERFKILQDHKWLFFPMNCGWAFMDDYQIESRIKGGYNREQALIYRNYVNNTLNIIFKWIVGLKNDIKDKNILIILRPHPSVSVQQYKDRFKSIAGYVPGYVYISKDLTVKQWLIASDVCYTNFSSVALDAQLIKKPTYLMEPEPYPYFIQMSWYDAFLKLKSFSEFYNSIENKLNIPKSVHPVLTEYVDTNLDGIKETAKYLAEFASEKKFPSWSLLGLLKGILDNPRQTIGSFLRFLAMVSKFDPFRAVRIGIKADFFKRDDVTRFLKSND